MRLVGLVVVLHVLNAIESQFEEESVALVPGIAHCWPCHQASDIRLAILVHGQKLQDQESQDD